MFNLSKGILNKVYGGMGLRNFLLDNYARLHLSEIRASLSLWDTIREQGLFFGNISFCRLICLNAMLYPIR